jgi:DNA-binding CsgD family transcriptional regulator
MKDEAFGGKTGSSDSIRRASSSTTTKAATLADRLRMQRQRSFVGRAAEIAVFARLLSDETRSLLFLSGAVGVGKTSLLQELQRLAVAAGHRALEVDVSLLAAQPSIALPGLREQLAAFALAGGGDARAVVFIDSFERLTDSGAGLFAEVEAMSADVLLVVASRRVLPPTLALDPAWSRLLQQRELAPFSAQESDAFLQERGVGQEARATIRELTQDFPLALAVAAEVLARHGQPRLTLEGAQEVQHTLSRLLCPVAVSHAQQLALDVCSLARATSAELVEAMRQALGVELQSGAQDLFNWLSLQSFVYWEPNGLSPHFLVRMALQARLRLDRPRRFRALTQALREYAVAELAGAQNPDTQLIDLFFLDRDVPTARRWLAGRTSVAPLEPARRSDDPLILELLRESEGREAEALGARYLQRESHEFEVARGEGVASLLHHVKLQAESQELRLDEADPASRLVREFVAQHPLEAQEVAILFRWFFEREAYQVPSPRLLALAARQAQLLLTGKVAYSFCVFRAPGDWLGVWKDLNVPWQVLGRFDLGAHEYSVVAFMWRRRTLRDVLVNAGRRSEGESAAMDPSLSADELRVKVAERVARLAQRIKLTAREAEILEQLCLGRNFEDIARNLSIRPRTVKFHQENLLRKTGASSRVELFRKLL